LSILFGSMICHYTSLHLY